MITSCILVSSVACGDSEPDDSAPAAGAEDGALGSTPYPLSSVADAMSDARLLAEGVGLCDTPRSQPSPACCRSPVELVAVRAPRLVRAETGALFVYWPVQGSRYTGNKMLSSEM